MRLLTSAFILLFGVSSLFAQYDQDTAAGNGRSPRNGSAPRDGAVPSMSAPDAFYAGAGAGVLDNLVSNDLAYQLFAGRIWRLNNFFGAKSVLEATTDFDNSVLASALVGANIYPTRTSIAPYLGAGAGLGYAHEPNTDVFGFDVSGTFGLHLLRDAPIEVKVETNANFLFRDINGSMPMTFTGRVGLLF